MVFFYGFVASVVPAKAADAVSRSEGWVRALPLPFMPTHLYLYHSTSTTPATVAAEALSPPPTARQTLDGGIVLLLLLFLLSPFCWVLANLSSGSKPTRGSRHSHSLWRLGWTALAGASPLAAVALAAAEPMLVIPSLVLWGVVPCLQRAVVATCMLYLACVSGGLLLELLALHLPRLEARARLSWRVGKGWRFAFTPSRSPQAVLQVVHKTRDCVAGLFLFAPQFALGARDTEHPPCLQPAFRVHPRRLTSHPIHVSLSQVCCGCQRVRTRLPSSSNLSSTRRSTTRAGTLS